LFFCIELRVMCKQWVTDTADNSWLHSLAGKLVTMKDMWRAVL